MARRRFLMGFCAGLAAGVLAMFFLAGDLPVRKLMAQEPVGPPAPAVAEMPRYQMAVYAYPGYEGASGIQASSFGTYILDSVSGKVWLVKENGSPQPLWKQ